MPGLLDYLGGGLNKTLGGNIFGGDPELEKRLRMQAMGQGPSLAGMQGAQSLAQGAAQQRSMVAGAAPGQQAGARLAAMQNTGNLGAQINQQTQMNQLMERERAQQALMQYLAQNPTMGQRLLGAGMGALQARLMPSGSGQKAAPAQPSGWAALFSDRNLKTDTRTVSRAADEFMSHLAPKSYRYKDPAHGEGRRLGIMAQDVERSRLAKHAVMDTPQGKMLDTAKLTGPILAAVARLNERLAKVEKK